MGKDVMAQSLYPIFWEVKACSSIVSPIRSFDPPLARILQNPGLKSISLGRVGL